jgi:hypothetical protein
MICPKCKCEIERGDLLITWWNDDVDACWDDDLTDLAEYLKTHGKNLPHFEFEHDDLECFFSWAPSQEEIKEILEQVQQGDLNE